MCGIQNVDDCLIVIYSSSEDDKRVPYIVSVVTINSAVVAQNHPQKIDVWVWLFQQNFIYRIEIRIS